MKGFLYRKREKHLLYQKEIYFQMWTDAFLHLIGEQWKRLNFIADHPVIVKELHERTIGDAREDFWLKQYEDHDFRNLGGESLNEMKVRMKAAINSIFCRMEEGETALVVSHATAICHICFLTVKLK